MGGALKLTSATYSNQGYYVCTARNTFGFDTGYVRVQVRRRRKLIGLNSGKNCKVSNCQMFLQRDKMNKTGQMA